MSVQTYRWLLVSGTTFINPSLQLQTTDLWFCLFLERSAAQNSRSVHKMFAYQSPSTGNVTTIISTAVFWRNWAHTLARKRSSRKLRSFVNIISTLMVPARGSVDIDASPCFPQPLSCPTRGSGALGRPVRSWTQDKGWLHRFCNCNCN